MSGRIYPTGKSDELEDTRGMSFVDMGEIIKTMVPELTKQASKSEESTEDKEACVDSMDKKTVRTSKEKKSDTSPELSVIDGKVRVPSAKFLEAALDRGDEESYLKALEARSQFRQMLLKQAETLEKNLEKKEVLAKRSSQRKEVLASVEEAENKKEIEARRNWRKKVLAELGKKEEKVASKEGFKKASELDDNERQAIQERLSSLGFDGKVAEYYTESVLKAKSASGIPGLVVKLAKNDKLERSAKEDLLREFIKEAELTPGDKNRILDYWKNELGYVADWSDDLVADVDPVKGG